MSLSTSRSHLHPQSSGKHISIGLHERPARWRNVAVGRRTVVVSEQKGSAFGNGTRVWVLCGARSLLPTEPFKGCTGEDDIDTLLPASSATSWHRAPQQQRTIPPTPGREAATSGNGAKLGPIRELVRIRSSREDGAIGKPPRLSRRTS
ncbi:hypothetical protein L1887_48288 [Cichorium endivia]|nr:hypothetical protein L1887_48288 [Cichorium endivia]